MLGTHRDEALAGEAVGASDPSSKDRSQLARLGFARAPVLSEYLLALAATVALVGGSIGANARLDAPRTLDGVGIMLVVLAGACLAWLLAAPIPSIVVAVLFVSVYLTRGYPYGPIQLSVVVLMLQVARTRSLRTSGLVCLIGSVAATAAVLSRLASDDVVPPEIVAVTWVSWLVIPWLLGTVIRLRAEAAARTRSELVSLVTARERMRVAGEVHDIAGHGFAVIAMQVGVALVAFDDDREQARASMEAIQSLSSRGLTDLRRMLGTFHPPSGHSPTPPPVSVPAAPPPPPDQSGLAELPTLLDELVASGLVVDRDIDDVGPLPAEVEHVVYRVVQESLTNVVKHAHADLARVSVHREQDTVTVRVSDSGTGGDFTAGNGLAGMGQRVGAVGGRLRAAPRDDGGFEVEATMPVRRWGGDNAPERCGASG